MIGRASSVESQGSLFACSLSVCRSFNTVCNTVLGTASTQGEQYSLGPFENPE